MKKTTVTLIIAGLIFVAGVVAAWSLLFPTRQADVEAMSTASVLYEAGHYLEAIQVYEQLIAQGAQDSALFYNLGNAYFRQGDLGHAMLNYQRGAVLNPRDADIKANLELARASAPDIMIEEAAGPLELFTSATAGWLNMSETALLVLGFWFLLGWLFLAWRALQPGKLRALVPAVAAVTLLLLLLTGVSLVGRFYQGQVHPSGLVVAPVVAVSSGPGDNYESAYDLHAGTEVNLEEIQGNWARMEVPGGSIQGWIPLDAVETLSSGPDAIQPLL